MSCTSLTDASAPIKSPAAMWSRSTGSKLDFAGEMLRKILPLFRPSRTSRRPSLAEPLADPLVAHLATNAAACSVSGRGWGKYASPRSWIGSYKKNASVWGFPGIGGINPAQILFYQTGFSKFPGIGGWAGFIPNYPPKYSNAKQALRII